MIMTSSWQHHLGEAIYCRTLTKCERDCHVSLEQFSSKSDLSQNLWHQRKVLYFTHMTIFFSKVSKLVRISGKYYICLFSEQDVNLRKCFNPGLVNITLLKDYDSMEPFHVENSQFHAGIWSHLLHPFEDFPEENMRNILIDMSVEAL